MGNKNIFAGTVKGRPEKTQHLVDIRRKRKREYSKHMKNAAAYVASKGHLEWNAIPSASG
jgi:hypothetical protein